MLKSSAVGQISTVEGLAKTYKEEISNFVPEKGKYTYRGSVVDGSPESVRVDVYRWGEDGQAMDAVDISIYVSKFLRRVFNDESGKNKQVFMCIENNNSHLSLYFEPDPIAAQMNNE